MPRQQRMDLDELVNDYRAGDSVKTIVQRYGVTPRTVYQRLRRANEPLRSPRGRGRCMPPDVIVARYVAGESKYQIAKSLGVGYTTVSRVLERAGVAVRSRQARPMRRTLSAEAIRDAYVAGESRNSIAKRLGVVRKTVDRRLAQFGIPLRSRTEANQLATQIHAKPVDETKRKLRQSRYRLRKLYERLLHENGRYQLLLQRYEAQHGACAHDWRSMKDAYFQKCVLCGMQRFDEVSFARDYPVSEE